MVSGQTTRRVYSAEELHRLRNAYSLPKLEEAIEERDGEDAEIVKVVMTIGYSESIALNLKWIDELIATPPEERAASHDTNVSPTEHVLRGSKSFTAQSFRSRVSARSLRVPSATSNDENAPLSMHTANRQLQAGAQPPSADILGEIAGNSQTIRPILYKFGPSPTPSMKRRKAEAIVKAHGSPTHIRVTAGGRIVPSEQSPLCHPRYGYSAVKANGGLIKFAPNYHAGKAQWTRATENGFVAQDVHGNLCQIVNGMVLPLNQVDGALRLYIPAPNLKVTQRGSNQGPVGIYPHPNDGHQPSNSEVEAALLLEPSIPSQISALELEYARLEHDLKDVDKTEVIHGRTMSKGGKDALVARRRELVLGMDKVRKALKALKRQPPPNAPTSPRALAHVHSASPPIARHLPFSSHQNVSDPMKIQSQQPMYSPYVGGPPAAPFNASFGFHPMPALSELYASQSWGYGNPGMFVPSPGDESLGAPPPIFQEQELISAFQQMSILEPAKDDANVPQNDGSGSQVEPQVRSPSRSHAVPIKAPDNRSTGQRSTLNPMSPAYKPAFGAKASKRDSVDESMVSSSEKRSCEPLVASLKDAGTNRACASADEGTSPTKRDVHLQSSSISSFETADFFPRNTFEYSTRLRSPHHRHESANGKENKDPESPVPTHDLRPATPHQEAFREEWQASRERRFFKNHSPHLEQSQPPAPPPGTPVHPNDAVSKASTSIEIDQALWHRKTKTIERDVPSRADHNVSPKSKRGLISAADDRQEAQYSANPSLETMPLNQNEITTVQVSTNVIDFTRKPREWIEGYQAGLRRQQVGGDRNGDFLDGYCEGLLKSKPVASGPTFSEQSTGSPTRSTSRRTNPASVSWSSKHQREDTASSTTVDPVDGDTSNIAMMKQAIISPQNEEAVLTPSVEGRHVTEYPLSLGAWAKTHNTARADDMGALAARFFSENKVVHTGISDLNKRRVTSDDGKYSSRAGVAEPADIRSDSDNRTHQLSVSRAHEHTKDRMASPKSPKREENTEQSLNISNHKVTRVDSVTGIDSSLNRPWPGHAHLDIKPASSISRAASVATGCFTHSQFDGTPHNNRITSAASTTIVPTNAHGRFNESSLNRVMSSPSTPPAPTWTSSPKRTPANESPRRKLGAQGKACSPAKSTFNNLAEKVGIKVSPNMRVNTDDGAHPGAEGVSPSGKRRWRDVWRGGARKDDNH